MKLSASGLNFIKKWEGLRLEVYDDIAGLSSIGYGHLIKSGEKFTKITEQEAEELLVQDVEFAEDVVNQLVGVSIVQREFDALVSLVYNIGRQNFKKSTLLRLVNQYEFDLAADQFARWIHAGGKKSKGLIARRADEKALFWGEA